MGYNIKSLLDLREFNLEDTLMCMAQNIEIVNLPFISFVFKKDDIDRIANDTVTYQRGMTSKCPMSFLRKEIIDNLPSYLNYKNSPHEALLDDDNVNERGKREYISDCFKKRVSICEINTIRKMLSNGDTDITKYILSVFLRRILKTNGKIEEIDDLVANVIPLEQITTSMMSKYKLLNKLPLVELMLLISVVVNSFVPLVIVNDTIRYTKRSPFPVTVRICCNSNNDNIPIGNIVVLVIRIPAFIENNTKYVLDVGTDHRCCRIRDFTIDFFEKLDKSKLN